MIVNENYRLGLPAWAFPGWKDRFFTDRPSRLASYADVFNTVEGNTTFYRIPDDSTVRAWRDAVADRDFRFCFKLPREVTHEREPDLPALERFLTAIDPLRDKLGPIFVQFPATLAPEHLPAVMPIFDALYGVHRFVIEVRHRSFFTDPELLAPVLDRYQAGRVVLDSRPLYEGDRAHPEVLQALHEKPDVPVRAKAFNDIAFVRLILHPDIASNAPYIEELAIHVAAWLAAGTETYMMIHCPNNLHCPPIALEFHEALRSKSNALPPLPPWPIPQQRDLL